MTHTARAVFTFKSAETKAAFINFCSGERGLGITRAWEGCISIECYESADNPLEMTIWQKWESASNHEAYVAMRKEAGDFDMLADWVAAPPDIKALHPVDMVTDEEKIHAIIKETIHSIHILQRGNLCAYISLVIIPFWGGHIRYVFSMNS